jgi:hypothetical protein
MTTILLASALVVAVSAQAGLKFDPPKEWTSKPSTSSMRVAEFTVPPAAGDRDETTVVVYYFGGQGGSVEANLERWTSQMQQPDGRPSKDAAKRETTTVRGLTVTTLDVPGTYVAETAPGSGQRVSKPNYHLKAAVIETPKGPYFVKLTGPAKTVAQTGPSYDAFIKSMRVE